MTRLAASPENCKNGNVTWICIQEVTVHHCTLLVLSKPKSVFCCQSDGSAVTPWNCLWGHQGTLGTGSLWHERDEALCFLKRETTLRTNHIPQDLLEMFGIGWKCDYKQWDVTEDGWCEKLEPARALERDLNWWEKDFRLGSCLSSRCCRVNLQGLGTYMDKDIHMQLSQLKLPLFQLSMLLDLFILKNNFIKSVYNIWAQCL